MLAGGRRCARLCAGEGALCVGGRARFITVAASKSTAQLTPGVLCHLDDQATEAIKGRTLVLLWGRGGVWDAGEPKQRSGSEVQSARRRPRTVTTTRPRPAGINTPPPCAPRCRMRDPARSAPAREARRGTAQCAAGRRRCRKPRCPRFRLEGGDRGVRGLGGRDGCRPDCWRSSKPLSLSRRCAADAL